ncbi:hypothetical protein ACE6H2_022757 [Prunus campanulata]
MDKGKGTTERQNLQSIKEKYYYLTKKKRPWMFVFGLKSLKLLENQETIKPLGYEVLSTFSSFPCPMPTPKWNPTTLHLHSLPPVSHLIMMTPLLFFFSLLESKA